MLFLTDLITSLELIKPPFKSDFRLKIYPNYEFEFVYGRIILSNILKSGSFTSP